jgi:hypothetical protein
MARDSGATRKITLQGFVNPSRLPCSRLSRENTRLLTRAVRSAQDPIRQSFAARRRLRSRRSRGPCLCRTRHPFAVSSRCRPSQVIEFVFAASPETTRREPQEFPSPSRVAAGPGSLRCRGSLSLSRSERLGHRAIKPFSRYEGAVTAVYGKQIGHQLSSHSQSRTIGVALLFFFFINQSKFVALLRSKLLPLLSIRSECACSVVLKWEFEELCLLSSSRRHRARSS